MSSFLCLPLFPSFSLGLFCMSVSLPACPSVFFSCLGVSYARLTFALKSSFCWSVHLSHCSWTLCVCVCVCVCVWSVQPASLSLLGSQTTAIDLDQKPVLLFFLFFLSFVLCFSLSGSVSLAPCQSASHCLCVGLVYPPPPISQLSRISHIRETTWLC